MNIQSQDEVIKELWNSKNQLANSSKRNISELVEKVNKIATEKGFFKNKVSHCNQQRDHLSNR